MLKITTSKHWTPKPRSTHNARGYVLLSDVNHLAEQALEDAGLAVLNNYSGSDLDELYSAADAILIPGGGDVSPALYGQECHKTTYPSHTRDTVEYSLAQRALADGLPILGICRGHQMMNVAAGGTLIQDIPTMVSKAQAHCGAGVHSIITERNTILDELGIVHDAVNSLHHQSVDTPGSGFHIAAYALDGIVEAIVSSDSPFALGVQFHPEMMPITHKPSELIFEILAQHAETHFHSRSRRFRRASSALFAAQDSLPYADRFSKSDWEDMYSYGDDGDYGGWDGISCGTSSSRVPNSDRAVEQEHLIRLMGADGVLELMNAMDSAIVAGDYASWRAARNEYVELVGEEPEIDWGQWGNAFGKDLV